MKRWMLTTFGFVLASSLVQAQSSYRLPPPEVVKILDTPLPPAINESPTRETLLLVDVEGYPPIKELARPILRLAGVRIDPGLGGRQRTVRYSGITIVPLDGRPRLRVELPPGARIGMPIWSPDGSAFAFTRDLSDGIELWVADSKTGLAHAIPELRLVDVLGRGFEWEDSRHLLIQRVAPGRGAAPAEPEAPSGPNIEEASGKVAQVATYQDLLKSPRDEELFAYYATSQLARLEAATGAIASIGEPGLIASAEVSPDGKYILVTTLRTPFSYRVPYQSFAKTIVVLDTAGKLVKTIADLPVADDTPRQGVPKGPRGVGWTPNDSASLIWAEALDGGDPTRKAPYRDQLMVLDAPFTDMPGELLKVKHRFTGLNWLTDGRVLLTETDRDRRWRTTSLINLKNLENPQIIFDLSINDAYGNPGTPVLQTRPDGQSVILQDGDSIYLLGRGRASLVIGPFSIGWI